MFHRGFVAWGPAVGGGRLILLVFFVLVAAAAITALVIALRDRPAHQAGPVPPRPPIARSDAARILDERYARGEIDDEEYQRRRAVLNSSQ